MSSEKKATLYSEYAVDVESGETGKWVRDAFRGGIGVRVRSQHSKVFRLAKDKVDARNLKYHRREVPVPADIQDKNASELACAALADWENVTDENGNALPCTDENKKRVLSDPRLREVRDSIVGLSISASTFRAEVEADAENLSPASAPSSTPEAPQDTQAA